MDTLGGGNSARGYNSDGEGNGRGTGINYGYGEGTGYGDGTGGNGGSGRGFGGDLHGGGRGTGLGLGHALLAASLTGDSVEQSVLAVVGVTYCSDKRTNSNQPSKPTARGKT